MITTPSFVLTAVSVAERNKTSAIIFTGLGFGIFVAGLLVAGFGKGSPHASASLVYAGLGLGAMLGSLFGNWLPRLFGLYFALIVVMAACVVTTLLIFCHSTILITGSCFLMGLLFTAMVMLISTRILELEGGEKHANVWGVMTIGFAIGQLFSTYFVIYVDHVSKHQGASFIFAAIMFFFSLVLVYLAKR